MITFALSPPRFMTATNCRHILLPKRSGDGCPFLYLWFLVPGKGLDRWLLAVAVSLSALGRVQQSTPEFFGRKKYQKENVNIVGALDSPGAGLALSDLLQQLGIMGLVARCRL